MKKFLFGLVLLATQLAHGAGPLLKYRYGSQINYSELTIQLDGTIQRTEKKGGGAEPESLPELKLTQAQRRQLFVAIDAVSKVDPLVTEGSPSTFGSSSGSLKAFSQLGEHVVRVIERSDEIMDGNDIVTYSPAAEARWIEDLVFSYVDVDMYR